MVATISLWGGVQFGAMISMLLAGAPTVQGVVGALKYVLLAYLAVAALVQLPRVRHRPTGLLASVGVLFAVSAVVGVTVGSPSSALDGFRVTFLPIALVVVVAVLLQPAPRPLLRWFVVIGQVSAAIAVATWCWGLSWLEFLAIPKSSPYGWFPQTYFVEGNAHPRAFSPFATPNELGLCLIVVLVCCWSPAFASWRTRAALSLLPLVALALSQSRSAWLGAAVALAVRVAIDVGSRLDRRTRAALLAGAAAAAVGFALIVAVRSGVLAGSDTSSQGHLDSVSGALQDIAARPWGHGLGTAGSVAQSQGPEGTIIESYLLAVAYEAGVLGLLCYLAVLATVVWPALRRRDTRAGPRWYPWRATLLALVVGTLPNQLLLPTLQGPPAAFSVWIGLGVAFGWVAYGSWPDSESEPTSEPGLVSGVTPPVDAD